MANITIQPYAPPPQSGGDDAWWQSAPVARPEAPQGGQSSSAGAISAVESGGNYRAVGPETGKGRALGKYQVMEFNVGPWTREALGVELTPGQYLSSPEAQDAVFAHKFGQYEKKYGPEGAARAWFAGEGGMNDMNRRDILGTTVAAYSRKFTNALGPSTAYAAEAPQQQSPASASSPAQDDWWKAAPLATEKPPEPPSQTAPAATPAAAPQTSVSTAIGRGAAQGATLNFYDELRGLMEAGGLNPNDPASLSALVQGAVKYWSGDKSAEQRYDAATGRERAADATAQQDRPYSSIAGNLAGAVALPIGGALQAATLPGRIARGVGVGAAVGAGYGAGEGSGAEDRANRALTGAAIGGVVGGAAPPVLEGIGKVGGAALAPIVNTVRGLRNPDAEAGRRVMTALQRDARNGQGGLTPQEMITARSEGAPVANIDMGGETTRALARSAANTSPEARAALNRTIDDRFEGQAGRAIDAIASVVRTPANAHLTREALQAAADKARAPFYQRAFKAGQNGIWDGELEQLAQSPAMQTAIKEATQSIQNKVSTGRSMNPVAHNGNPTLEFWDQVKRNLDSKYRVFSRQGDKEAAADIQAIKSALVEKLDKAVPEYAVARGVASKLFGASDALEAGEKFVTANMKNADYAKIIGKMTPEEKTLFAEGFASKMVEKISERGERRNVIAEISKSPAARDRIRLALGPDGAQRIDAFITREAAMDLARGAVQGNSTTVRQLVEAGLAGGAYGAYSGNWDVSTVMAGMIAFGARRGQLKIDQRVAKRVGEMLASDDPLVLRRGLDLVTKSPGVNRALQIAEEYLTSVNGQQAPKTGVLPSLSAPVPGHAEDQQPTVPRPPGQ